jgi:YidC/Oxa1 family membrane protein insertase
MNPFSWFSSLFNTLVYYPQLNLLKFFFNITNDIGWAIVLVAIVVNLLLWKFIVESFLSGIKMKILAPQIKQIQEKNKINKGESTEIIMAKSAAMRKENGELYKKHGVKTGSFFWVLFFQLFFASGVFYVVNNVSNAIKNKVPIEGLYANIFNTTTAAFPQDGLSNLIKIDLPSTTYLWLPILSMILSYLYGMYTFKWSPSIKEINDLTARAAKKEVKKVDNKSENKDGKQENNLPTLDPIALQRNQELLIIYFLPVMTFFINSSFSAGLNLYFATLSLFNLLRQIIIAQYYAKHVDQMLKDLVDSDPSILKSDIVDVEVTSIEIDSMASNQTKTSATINKKKK